MNTQLSSESHSLIEALFPGLQVTAAELNQHMQQHEFDAFVFKTKIVLGYFCKRTYIRFSDTQLQEIEALITAILSGTISEQLRLEFITAHIELVTYSMPLAYLTSLTSFKHTDSALEVVSKQPFNFLKVLFLYSPLNHFYTDENKFFRGNGYVATLWWSYTIYHCVSVPSKHVYDNITKLLNLPEFKHYFTLNAEQSMSIRFPYECHAAVARLSTFNTPLIRHHINQALIKSADFYSYSVTDMTKIAIISKHLIKGHPVYNKFASYLRALRQDYHITLLLGDHLESLKDRLDNTLYDEVYGLAHADGSQDSHAVRATLHAQSYGTIIFTDVEDNFSIVGANTRLAPVMISLAGYPLSTSGALIDYTISGRLVESSLSSEPYSEEQQLLPHFGFAITKPNYTPSAIKHHQDVFSVLCPWLGQVKNYPHLHLMKHLIAKTQKLFNLTFTGSITLTGALAYTTSMLKESFKDHRPNHFFIKPNDSYDGLMKEIESCDLVIDNYPFHDVEKTVAALYLKKPVLVYEGQDTSNRLSSAILRHLGLEELVATNMKQFVSIFRKLCEDEAYYTYIIEKIQALDLDTHLFSLDDAQAFKESITNCIEHYESSQTEPLHKNKTKELLDA